MSRRKVDHRLIKTRRSYTVEKLAQLLGCHKKHCSLLVEARPRDSRCKATASDSRQCGTRILGGKKAINQASMQGGRTLLSQVPRTASAGQAPSQLFDEAASSAITHR
jgi:hypothetical protein